MLTYYVCVCLYIYVCVYIYIYAASRLALAISEMGVLGPTGIDRLSGAELASLAWAHATTCRSSGRQEPGT